MDPVPALPMDPVPALPMDPVPALPMDPVPALPMDPAPALPTDRALVQVLAQELPQHPPTLVQHPIHSSGGGILDPVTSILGPVTSAVLPPVSSLLSGVTSGLGDVTSAIIPPVTSAISDITSAVVPPVTSAVSDITSAIIPPVTSAVSDITSVIPPPVTSIISSVDSSLPTSLPPSDGGTTISSPTSAPPTSVTSLLPPVGGPTDSGSVSASGPTSDIPTSTSGSLSASAGPTISFPSPPANATSSGSTAGETSSAATVTSTVVATLSVQPGLSFVLTESSLAFTSVPTPSVTDTLTDPDAATTTISPIPDAATTLTVAAALPTGIPARIFPRDQLDLSNKQQFEGYTLISLLFNNELNWPFVVNSSLASSQIFAYTPVLITTALNIQSSDIMTYALQVYVPAAYQGPNDASLLGSTWLGYIPTSDVDSLAAQIKAKNSPFYNDVPNGVAKDLAERVVSGYDITSIPDPTGSGSGGSSNNSNGGGSGSSGKSRQDAIIGVVSALGAIALLVLVFLVYRSIKRRKALAHRRLSDPPDEVLGVRPEGRQFDQDSVGGARRRSFYYAEDSLRGYENQGNVNEGLMRDVSPTMPHTQEQQQQQIMTQRRNMVNAGAISSPVLQGSTMNW
ncbi:hypothetical protein NP233_g9687 [Leucocoprinus birnbaumii]|uniref:Uncharacterized protein n=1 Tax=Leucocoprinus birnbaumii TaxID=56174 RepID=A0AAD5YM02_9AGAR|nr:hypothetical protein NP233_g9687 [Leucocoprinus birnbaumii]